MVRPDCLDRSKAVRYLSRFRIIFGCLLLLGLIVFQLERKIAAPAGGSQIKPAASVLTSGTSPLPSAQTPPAAMEYIEATAARSDGFHSLGDAMEAARYGFEPLDAGSAHARGASYFAANPREQLRAWFGAEGLELASGIPHAEEETPWSFRFKTTGFGRLSDLQDLGSREVAAAGAQVEIRSESHGFTEWFRNDRQGLEQGFTVGIAPAGTGEIHILLGIAGDLEAEPDPASGGIILHDQDRQPILRYAGLKAWDAAGKSLSARMAVHSERQIAISVDDAGAKYPITIDPLFTNLEARLTQDSGIDSEFGRSVAISADTAAIGVPLDDSSGAPDAGSVYIFTRSGAIWTQQAKLTPGDPRAGDRFGYSVALHLDTVLIGAYLADSPGAKDSGSAHVYVRTGTTWTQQARLSNPLAVEGDAFGEAVALKLNTAVIGSPGADNGDSKDTGAAHVFTRTGTTWSLQATLLSGSRTAGDRLGESVALSGESSLVGAPGKDIGTDVDAGVAFVFVRSGTAWSQQAMLGAADGAPSDLFGSSVALDGQTAVVGAEGDNLGGASDAGSAYVFVRSGGSWSPQAKLQAPDAGQNDEFGNAVSISGETLVIGSHADNTPAGVDAGSALVFTRSAGSWSIQQRLTASNGGLGDDYGQAVAIEGETLLIGAVRADTVAGNTGAAYVYSRTGTTWTEQGRLGPAVDDPSEDLLGSAVAISGETALVGASADDTAAGVNSGTAFVFLRKNGTWSQQTKLSASDAGPSAAFGVAVGIFGNTAIIGSHLADPLALSNAGAAYIFQRTGTAWSEQAILTAADAAAGDSFGMSVAISGETVVAGTSLDDTGDQISIGGAYVFVRSGTSWAQQAKLVAADGTEGDQLGRSVSISGDTVVAGAFGDSISGVTGAGSAYVFTRSGLTWTQQAKLLAPDKAPNDSFGFAVSVDADTALIGAFNDDTPRGTGAGSAYVFARTGSTWRIQAKLTASDSASDDAFGYSVALSRDRAVMGAYLADTGQGVDAGSAYVFNRLDTVWSQDAKITSSVDGSTSDQFGNSVAIDGETVIAGAWRDGYAGPEGGSAYAFNIGELPEIVTSPTSRTVVPGTTVMFSVIATGSGTLSYQWRKDGFDVDGANGPSIVVPAAGLDDQGNYDVVVSNAGGAATSGVAVLFVNALSQFQQTAPGPAGENSGFINVSLLPAGIPSAWRFVGELEWRAPGVPAGGLTTGNREIEFRPVPGFLHPLREPVSIISGQPATLVEREYFSSGNIGTGSLSVTLLPAALAGAQWRLLGDPSAPWRNSGDILSGLPPGVYLIECRDVAGFATPPPISSSVTSGQTAVASATYFLADAPTGAQPQLVGADAVQSPIPNPFTFVGQLRSDAGAGTGFVVRQRVVATAAHVVFSDATLAPVTGLQWLFQRERGVYEPVPQVPRGSYILSGYAAQRAVDSSPGASSPESQNQDVAAVWFFEEDAGRGGFAGYLASDAVANEWLISPRLKSIVGYPLDGIAEPDRGRVHATPPINARFENANGRVYLTDDVTSRGGNSGGPFLIRYDDHLFYPAAVYLGGTTQTRVRAIDRDVIVLFDSAEESSNTGQNSTNGGIPQTNSSLVGTPSGTLVVNIEPAAARNAGAGWRIGSSAFVPGGQSRPFLSAGSYTVDLKSIAGFNLPASQTVTVNGGSTTLITVTYPLAAPPVLSGATVVRLVRGQPASINLQATNNPTSYAITGQAGSGLSLVNTTTGEIAGTPTQNGTFQLIATARNAAGTSVPLAISVIVADPGTLMLQVDATLGSVKVKPSSDGNIFPQGEAITLIAKPKDSTVLFAGWEFIGLDSPASSTTSTTTTFAMTESVVANALFVPNPFTSRNGKYLGLLKTAGVQSGSISLKVGKTGSFTLKFDLPGIKQKVKGVLGADGSNIAEIPRAGLSPILVELRVDLAAAEPVLTGSVTIDGIAYDLEGIRSGFSKTNPTSLAGTHNVSLKVRSQSPALPQGNGYLQLNITTSGSIRTTGKLGDGTAVSLGGKLRSDQRWAFYTAPYSGGGVLAGEVVFQPASSNGLEAGFGTVRLQKPATSSGPYPLGFDELLDAVGSRYFAPPAGTRVLPIDSWDLTIGQGVITDPVRSKVTLSAANEFTLVPSDGTTLKLKLTTGLFKGTVSIPGEEKATKFSGVLLPLQQSAAGLIIIGDQSGTVTITPP